MCTCGRHHHHPTFLVRSPGGHRVRPPTTVVTTTVRTVWVGIWGPSSRVCGHHHLSRPLRSLGTCYTDLRPSDPTMGPELLHPSVTVPVTTHPSLTEVRETTTYRYPLNFVPHCTNYDIKTFT